MVLELKSHVLNFSNQETSLLLQQAAWQVNAACADGNTSRETHVDLEELDFGLSLIAAIDYALNAVEANFQGSVALRTFVLLTTRLLSMSPHTEVHHRCISFLRRSRDIAIGWLRDLGLLIQESLDQNEMSDLGFRALEVALTCHETFDVDQEHLGTLLASKGDIAALVECSIAIHDRRPAGTSNLGLYLRLQLLRSQRLSHFLERHTREQISQSHTGIDTAIKQIWKGYHPSGSWVALESPSERWVETKTTRTGDRKSMIVHFNLLTGELLVNGSLISRLPSSYEIHETYRRLFGNVSDISNSTELAHILDKKSN